MKRTSWRFALGWALVAGALAGCAGAPGRDPGDMAPAFSLPSVGGGEVALADFSGKPVLLYFHMAVG